MTVVRGVELAPAEMTAEGEAAARYLSESRAVLFVSSALFSGSCAPTANAEQDDDGAITLTIENSAEESCTDDANPYTFLVTGVMDRPSRLVVTGEGLNEPIEIDLTTTS